MTKSDLVAKITNLNPNVYQKDVIKLVDIFFETIVKAIEKRNYRSVFPKRLYWLFKFISFIPETWVKINSKKENKKSEIFY